MSYLSDFEEINGGYVTFGGNPEGGKISRKGKIKTGKLDFEDVYFVKELKFNLFSVAQMYDKKNSVLFTETECIVLSLEFKLSNGNPVLLRVPRENNMYNVDLKNIGKQHRASCKTKPVSSVNQTLQRSDNGTEFKNRDLNQFCRMKGIKREFSVARTPQPNGIAERKNKTLIEAARTMLADSLLPIPFWAEAVNTACYVQNRAINLTLVQVSINNLMIKSRGGNVQQYVLFIVWSSGSKNPQNTNGDDAFEEKEPEFEIHVSPSSSAQTKKHDDKTKREAKGKSHVESLTGYRNLSAEFEDFSDHSINEVNAVGNLVLAIRQLFTDSTNTFSVVGTSNAAASPTHEFFSYIDTSQLPDDPNMLELEDITYSNNEEDVGAGGLHQFRNNYICQSYSNNQSS
nr:putative ribonuclease H-like domain-containing protein [Tanacetum cinerariifolium]GFA19728.1 putative ribonuclease H-like domain-containing protein [Tanacetum cinerariifolium]